MANLPLLAPIAKKLPNKTRNIDNNVNKERMILMTKTSSKVYKPKMYKKAIMDLINFK